FPWPEMRRIEVPGAGGPIEETASIECGDNAISTADGSQLLLSAAVYDFANYGSAFIGVPIDGVADYPTYMGAQASCYCNPQADPTCKQRAMPDVDFQNGGVDIVCADSIDARGDINLNGLANEIADAVMFTNYFIQGVSAFGTHIQGSIAASDVNADGLALTVADLVYLIRVIVGDAAPYDKAIPVAANVTIGDGNFSVDVPMGAAHIVIAGEVTPTLLATNMEMKYGVVDGNTNILVFSTEANQSFTGQFLNAEGRVISANLATFLGQPVSATVMPANYALHQNYPNPFNPTTTFKIDIPKAGVDWTLNIYNVTGQLVQNFSGVSTGSDEVVWDASNNASGIYFYKLTAGDFSATKKAVLLK
ncbi:MAG: T9SS type A sorting domain-containing protein, partial [candidate division Zixibacteria bacterium]|nr:T9SS type A sorting domain-containing protein [candidate division Zixibacteria bacterium]